VRPRDELKLAAQLANFHGLFLTAGAEAGRRTDAKAEPPTLWGGGGKP